MRLTDALAREIKAEAGQMVDIDRFFALAGKYANVTELTAPIVNELIVAHNPVIYRRPSCFIFTEYPRRRGFCCSACPS